jgi:hypothetical protein
MTNLVNAVQGKNNKHTLAIIVVNKPPKIVSFEIGQGNLKGNLVSQDGGLVTVQAKVFDPNGDDVIYQWSSDYFSNQNANDAAVFQFDPSQVNTGIYKLRLNISDGKLSLARTVQIKITGSRVTLADDGDQDGDGILDRAEAGDEDGNGIADYREPVHAPNELITGQDTVIRSPVGTKVLLGVMGDASGKISVAEIAKYHNDNGLSAYQNDNYQAVAIYDYGIEGLTNIGESAEIVIELDSPLPKEALLRKYSTGGGWSDFITDDKNTIMSLVTGDGACPDNAVWQLGLLEGANCLKLMIEDGGANDADGLANGTIEDPISVSVSISITVSADNVSLDNTALLKTNGEQKVLQFSLSASGNGASLFSLTIGNNVPISDTKSVTLYYDANGDGVVDLSSISETLSVASFAATNQTLQFTLDQPVQLQSGVTQFVVTYTFE